MKKMIIGKLIKNIAIIGLALILTLCWLGLTGCQQQMEEVEEPKIEEPQINIDVLEKEYNTMVGLVENVFVMLSEHRDSMTMSEAVEILEYIQNNRIKPTQKLTIELDNVFDELLEVAIKYVLASEADKPKFEARIVELLEEMDAISVEIEEIINNVNEI